MLTKLIVYSVVYNCIVQDSAFSFFAFRPLETVLYCQGLTIQWWHCIQKMKLHQLQLQFDYAICIQMQQFAYNDIFLGPSSTSPVSNFQDLCAPLGVFSMVFVFKMAKREKLLNARGELSDHCSVRVPEHLVGSLLMRLNCWMWGANVVTSSSLPTFFYSTDTTLLSLSSFA